MALDEVVDLLWPGFYNHLTSRLGFVFASGIADAFHHVRAGMLEYRNPLAHPVCSLPC